MNYPTAEKVRALLEHSDTTCISIYLPTHPIAAQNAREDMTRFKNLLIDARTQLSEEQLGRLFRSLSAAEDLIADATYWQHQSKGLAVFICEHGVQSFNLPVTAPEELHVDAQFFVTPLIESASQHKTLFVLAISRGGVRLLKSTVEGLEDVPVKGMPKSEADATKQIETEKLLANRGPAGGAGSYHGEGADTHEPHVRTRQYLLQVDDALCRHFNKHPEPVVLAALEPTLGMFCKLSHYSNLAAKLDIDPDSLSADRLHEKVWQVGASAFLDPVAEAKNAFGSYSANQPERVASDPFAVLEAAQAGRVATLLVARPVMATESNAFHESIPVGTEPSAFIPGTEIEQAVQAAYRTSGDIVMVPSHELPPGTQVAAVMRY
jgi:hypothetical protein